MERAVVEAALLDNPKFPVLAMVSVPPLGVTEVV
jgi:hypothetical protein